MITVKQAQETLTREDEAALTAAEARIDTALKKWDGVRAIVVLDGLALRRPVLDVLCARYRVGGWIVEVKPGDQRDPGPWVELRMPAVDDGR